ncbi:transmembrane protein [Pseudoscourfieldia marina]
MSFGLSAELGTGPLNGGGAGIATASVPSTRPLPTSLAPLPQAQQGAPTTTLAPAGPGLLPPMQQQPTAAATGGAYGLSAEMAGTSAPAAGVQGGAQGGPLPPMPPVQPTGQMPPVQQPTQQQPTTYAAQALPPQQQAQPVQTNTATQQQKQQQQFTAARASRAVRTSVPLEIFLYFGAWFDVIYCVLTFLIFLYKGTQLPYPGDAYSTELAYLFLFALGEPMRLFLTSKGNKTERSTPLLFGLGLTAPVFALHFYYCFGQTFVLRIDRFLSGFQLAFAAGQSLTGLLALLSFGSR